MLTADGFRSVGNDPVGMGSPRRPPLIEVVASVFDAERCFFAGGIAPALRTAGMGDESKFADKFVEMRDADRPSREKDDAFVMHLLDHARHGFRPGADRGGHILT